MSGRPTNPNVWCTGLPSYPAGSDAWSATPVVNAPVYTFFTPNTPPAAQEMNSVLNGLSQSQADTLNYIGQVAAQNFRLADGRIVNDAKSVSALAWDPFSAAWHFGIYWTDSFGPFDSAGVRFTQNGGESFAWAGGNVMASFGPFISLVVGGDGNNISSPLRFSIVALQNAAGTSTTLYRYDPLADSMTSAATIGAVTFSEGHQFGSVFCLMGAFVSGSHAPKFYSTADGVTFTNRTPASAHNRWTNTAAWVSAASPTMVVVLPRAQYVGADFVSPSLPNCMAHTSDGTTWTLRGFPGDGFQGVCWDSVRQIWYAVNTAIDGSGLPTGGSSTFWSSVDGLTWVSGATVQYCVTGLAAVGSLLLATTLAGNTLCSFDGATTWRQGGYFLSPNSTRSVTPDLTNYYQRPSVKSNGNRFVLYATSELAFGHNVGTPPVGGP